MSARPTDWSPVGWAGDPVPGDPSAVASAAADYRRTAEAVGDAIRNLQGIDAGSMHGKAIVAVLDQIKSVRDQLDKVESRVAGAASALEEYHPVLTTAQVESLAALQDAQGHLADRRSGVRAANQAANEYNSSNDPFQKESLKAEYLRAKHTVGVADAGLAGARARIQSAIEQRDSGAEATIRLLENIDNSSPIKDNLWDKITDWAGKVADWVSKYIEPIMKAIQPILDIAALVCRVAAAVLAVTGVGAPVAAALVGIATGLEIASKVIAIAVIALAFMKAISGRGSWGAFFGTAALEGVGMLLKKSVARKAADGVVDGIGKAAQATKATPLRSIARRICNNEIFVAKQIDSATDFVTDKVKDASVGLGKWALKNSVRRAADLPNTTYRYERCGAPAMSGGW